ncbi:tyrosine-type recombinase/integrase [Jatrophihabitans sp. GAS493]|uniref:tyrosine-type recombinase/integrase n=1 Tax=Jatrophihabitans sp. GAS493 TaxID=1907575 RepID=UPI0018D4E941|nr:tyrosine-type recombinase/integrase [Jatrophihabitans sp. GAS493]
MTSGDALLTVGHHARNRFHDARHTCGTLLHLQGVPVAVISAWLGHSNAAFTRKAYVHSELDALHDVARYFEREQ